MSQELLAGKHVVMLIDASTIGLPLQHYSMSKNRSIGRAQLTFRASLMG